MEIFWITIAVVSHSFGFASFSRMERIVDTADFLIRNDDPYLNMKNVIE